MFDGDLTALSTADLLESAAEHRAEVNRAEARLLEHAQVFADRNHPHVGRRRPATHPTGPGRERGVVLGGDGCPEIAEFAVAEFAVMLGLSSPAAAAYIGQALALRHRFPHIWAKVQSGEATPWRARKIAAACQDLSEETAASIDKRLARIVDTVTPHRLDNIVKAAQAHAAPEVARAKAEQRARERGVYVGRSDEYGSKKIFIRAASGNVIRFNATITSIAEALKIFGDTRSLAARRAEAIGIIADPRYTEELLLQARARHLTIRTTPTGAAPATHQDLDGVDPNAARGSAPTTGPNAARGSAPTTGLPRTDPGWADRDPGVAFADWSGHPPNEPGPDDEADRDAPHPSDSEFPDPLDLPSAELVEPFDAGLCVETDDGEPLDAAAQRALNARLAEIKQAAHAARGPAGITPGTAGMTPGSAGGQVRPGKTEIYVHLTDHTLATGTGVLRAETLGPLLAEQLSELVGHGPYSVKPVIDLNDAVSVDAYEIPDRIRERVKLTHPVELFPFGTSETRVAMDLDHIRPYDPLGPPGQTSTNNLAPLSRFGHRVKTHGHGWTVRRLDRRSLEWTTPHGFTFHVTPTGTTRVTRG
jgi:uncharacterized protein DUF222